MAKVQMAIPPSLSEMRGKHINASVMSMSQLDIHKPLKVGYYRLLEKVTFSLCLN